MRARALFFALVATATAIAIVFCFGSAPAQPPRGNPPKSGAAARSNPPKRPARANANDAGAAPSADRDAGASAALPAVGVATPSAKDLGDGGAVEVKKLDGGAQVIRFGELEIEGRLKSPQLVYFLRRVRAEFAAGDLGHRSFMGELSETRNDPSF